MTEFFRKNHGGGDNWTCQSTATGFVNSGNARGASGAEFFLIAKSAAPIHLAGIIRRLRRFPTKN